MEVRIKGREEWREEARQEGKENSPNITKDVRISMVTENLQYEGQNRVTVGNAQIIEKFRART